jgi:hypothetical protein
MIHGAMERAQLDAQFRFKRNSNVGFVMEE